MKMCDRHWNALREAISQRGLARFVASDGAAVVAKLAGDQFEPLMGAHNSILANAFNIAGLAIMAPKADGSETCPLCFLADNCPCLASRPCQHFEGWIDRAADDQLTIARERGLMNAS